MEIRGDVSQWSQDQECQTSWIPGRAPYADRLSILHDFPIFCYIFVQVKLPKLGPNSILHIIKGLGKPLSFLGMKLSCKLRGDCTWFHWELREELFCISENRVPDSSVSICSCGSRHWAWSGGDIRDRGLCHSAVYSGSSLTPATRNGPLCPITSDNVYCKLLTFGIWDHLESCLL